VFRLLSFDNHPNVNEVHLFDATYADTPGVIRWFQKRMNQDYEAIRKLKSREMKIAYMETKGGAFRNFYKERFYTTKKSEELNPYLPASSDDLYPWYRADIAALPHADFPKHFGPPLLKNVTHCPEVILFPEGEVYNRVVDILLPGFGGASYFKYLLFFVCILIIYIVGVKLRSLILRKKWGEESELKII